MEEKNRREEREEVIWLVARSFQNDVNIVTTAFCKTIGGSARLVCWHIYTEEIIELHYSNGRNACQGYAD